MSPQFEDAYFSREEHYSLGLETESGRHYLSIPVTTGIVDYEECYALTDEQYRRFLADPAGAVSFAEACRRREHDDLLIIKPGWNRGTPY